MSQFDVGMYIVDRNYRMLYINEEAKRIYPQLCEGDICYKTVACYDAPCENCPIHKRDVLFYNSVRKEWINAQSAKMHLPAYGECYSIHFTLKERVGKSSGELMSENQVRKMIEEMGASYGRESIIGGYWEEGYPLFYVNDNMVKMLGYENKEEVARAVDGMVSNFVHPDDRLQVRKDFENARQTGASFETVCRIFRKNGEWFWIVGRGKSVTTEDGRRALIAICMDMTTIFDRQNKLRSQYELLQRKDSVIDALLNNMPGGYHRCSLEEGFPLAYISDSFLNVVGWTRQEIQQILDNKYLNMVAPEDRAMFLGLEPQLMQEEKINCVYRIQRPDGSRRWVQDSSQYVQKDGLRYIQCAIADITDFVEGLNDRQRRLEEAMKRIEAVSHAKSAFLFNVSHDVRTPMNAIQGYTHIIEQRPYDAELVKDMVGKMKQSSNTLMQLLNDVLELSRIKSGKDSLDLITVDLDQFLEDIQDMFNQEMASAGITFRLEKSLQQTLVRCDQLKCTRILMNMLSNAKKFTGAGGTVVLGARQTDRNAYCFYVRDSGIGMSREFQDRAFEEFEREKSSTDSGVAGSGLGMAIIKRLADLMGGTCELRSELGKGTEISVTLTLEPGQDPEKENLDCPCLPADFTGKRILLVEDNAFNREIARFILENMSLQVEEAENGSAALKTLIQSEPGYFDLVLMDVQMPVMDGYTATQEIRQLENPVRSRVPIIAMTANAFKEDRDKCLEVGMNGHLSKPIDTEALAQTLTEFL